MFVFSWLLFVQQLGEKHFQFSIFNSQFFAGGRFITNHVPLQKIEN